MDKQSKIYVAGHRGLVGSAIMRKLLHSGYGNIITRTRKELDLTIQRDVHAFFEAEKPEYVFLAAAKVGGIHANRSFPADFTYENLMIESNVISGACQSQVKKLLFLGNSCAYPANCPQPILEEYLLSGSLEPTIEGYALAKIVGLKMCQYFNRQYGTDFISIMPTNVYGPHDNFDLQTSHVLSALLRKTHEAKAANLPQIEIWGTGKPLRDFLYADDLADACVFLMENYDGNEFFNAGTGKDITIAELAQIIKKVVGYEGELVFDTSKPDGMHRKLLDVAKLKQLGWTYKTDLEEGIRETYSWYLENINNL
jgi:GDP-L-fucose synthase